MSKPSNAAAEAQRPLSAEEVVEHLCRHPDFLDRHPEVLRWMAPPSRRRGDNVVDIQNLMIERLRRENERLEAKHGELVAATRGHMAAQARVHAAALDLLAAATFEHLIETVTTDLAVRLDVDVACLCVEGEPASLPAATRSGVRVLAPGAIDRRLGDGRDVALGPGPRPDAEVFGGGAGLVRSQALMRLTVSPAAPQGLLALGSRREGRFRQGQSTEVYGFLAGVVAIAIRSWLDLPG